MLQIGRTYWGGGKSFRCVYSELAHASTPKWERLWARSARRRRFLRATARHASALRRGDQSHEEVARGHPAHRAVCRIRVRRPIGDWRALASTAHRPDCWSQRRPLSPRRRTRAPAETRSPGLERIGGNDSARGRLEAAEERWPKEAPAGAAGASPSGEPPEILGTRESMGQGCVRGNRAVGGDRPSAISSPAGCPGPATCKNTRRLWFPSLRGPR